MALKLHKKKPQATVSAEQKQQGETVAEEKEQEDVPMPEDHSTQAAGEGPWCEVGMDISYTHNSGNYTSMKVGVTLKVPCLYAEVDETYDLVKEWLDGRMNELVEEITSDDE